MAIDKVEVEILAVGQGSCNVVKGLSSTGALEYLAILDAGGGSAKKSPAKQAMETLVKYMKERATSMGTGSSTDHYADLLLISHSDDDHYTIIKSILAGMEPDIMKSDTGRKVTVLPPKKTTAENPVYEDKEDENFAYATYAVNKIKAFGEDALQYVYLFQSEFDSGQNLYLLRVFNEKISPAYTEILRCGEMRVECTQITADTFEIIFNSFFSFVIGDSIVWWDRLRLRKDIARIHVTVPYISRITALHLNSNFPLSPSEVRYQSVEIPASVSPITFDAVGILKFLACCNPPGWEGLFSNVKFFCVNVASALATVDIVYGSSYYAPITKETILAKLRDPANKNDPSKNTIQFGEVVTSLSSEKVTEVVVKDAKPGEKKKTKKVETEFLPVAVGALTSKTHNHTRLRSVSHRYIPSIASCQLRITMIGVPDGGVNFYQTAYKGSAGSSDAMFRNMNSILTVVEALGIAPRFIFPGDATVQNLWYNMSVKDNADFLKGKGDNFFTLPHHGAYLTTHGAVPKESPKSVFFHFLTHIDPQRIYISAGYNSDHGHPNIWTMNECAAYFNTTRRPDVAGNIVYYNPKNDKHGKFLFCKYDKPLHGTVTLTENASKTHDIQAVSYCITFQGKSAIHSEILPRYKLATTTEAIEPLPAPGGSFPVAAVPVPYSLTNHPIFDFIFED